MTSFRSARLSPFSAYFALLVLFGCATYHPVPLPTAPDLAKTPSLAVPASEFLLPGLKPRPFPTEGLDQTAVVTLAVFNNPDLKAARLQAGVANAQLLEAGLLPDPQISAGYATSALNYGFSAALNEQIQSLITRGAAKISAREHQQQVHLDVLWQEWQVAERARELFIQIRSDSQLQPVLTSQRDVLVDRYRQDQAALEKSDVTANAVAADLTTLVSAETALRQQQIDTDLARHQLNALLGLLPGAQLNLIGPDGSGAVTPEQFHAAVAALPHRRADLLALAAGYQSQEQTVRQSILAQFPGISAGVEQGRDPVEGVNYFGPNVSLVLPLFNRNRGQIAIQRATRAVLHQSYQARLDQANGDAGQVWTSIGLMRNQLQDIDARLPYLEETAAAVEHSFRQGNLDAGLYVSMESSLLAKQTEAIHLRASLAMAQSALRTLLGLPFDTP